MGYDEPNSTCRSIHSCRRSEGLTAATNRCCDVILLADGQLAIALNSLGRQHHVSLTITFLSADGHRVSYQNWCRKWNGVAGHILDNTKVRRYPADFDLDIICKTGGRSAVVSYDLMSAQRALTIGPLYEPYELWEVVQPDPKAAPELEKVARETL